MACELCLISNICMSKINSQVIYCLPCSQMDLPCHSFQAPEKQTNFVRSLLKHGNRLLLKYGGKGDIFVCNDYKILQPCPSSQFTTQQRSNLDISLRYLQFSFHFLSNVCSYSTACLWLLSRRQHQQL